MNINECKIQAVAIIKNEERSCPSFCYNCFLDKIYGNGCCYANSKTHARDWLFNNCTEEELLEALL